MKPVKNKRIVRKKIEPDPYCHYKCRFCSEVDSGIVYWSETLYGEARLVNLDGELDDYNDRDSSNFMLHNCFCGSCGEESTLILDMFVACDAEGNVNPEER